MWITIYMFAVHGYVYLQGIMHGFFGLLLYSLGQLIEKDLLDFLELLEVLIQYFKV